MVGSLVFKGGQGSFSKHTGACQIISQFSFKFNHPSEKNIKTSQIVWVVGDRDKKIDGFAITSKSKQFWSHHLRPLW